MNPGIQIPRTDINASGHEGSPGISVLGKWRQDLQSTGYRPAHIGQLWAQFREPVSMNKVESDQG